jgi:hypothetical protein
LRAPRRLRVRGATERLLLEAPLRALPPREAAPRREDDRAFEREVDREDFEDERDRDDDDRARVPDEPRDALFDRPGIGSALTAFLAMSATVPAAVVTTDPTVLAAVPTPDVTVSRTVLFSSAIVPPFPYSCFDVSTAARPRARYPFFIRSR